MGEEQGASLRLVGPAELEGLRGLQEQALVPLVLQALLTLVQEQPVLPEAEPGEQEVGQVLVRPGAAPLGRPLLAPEQLVAVLGPLPQALGYSPAGLASNQPLSKERAGLGHTEQAVLLA